MRVYLGAAAAVGLSLTAAATAETIYVDDDAAYGGDGTSWASAFRDLATGLEAAADSGGLVTEVWVADGAYRPAGYNGDRTASFELPSGVGLYGGFAGWETTLEERDWVANPTILSGDLNHNDSGDTYHWNTTRSDNSYHVVTTEQAAPGTILDGFTITGGNANQSTLPNSGGAGLYNHYGSSTVRNCIFVNNTVYNYGGAMHNYSHDVTLVNCEFIDNSAIQNLSYGGGWGGAVWSQDSEMAVANCRFLGNTAGADGGGLFLNGNTLVLANCLFTGNSTFEWGSGGGACAFGSAEVVNCTFWGNSATYFGGMLMDTGTVANTIFRQNTGGQLSDSAVVTYSCVEGGFIGSGNINVAPQFVDADGPDDMPGTDDDDLHLSPGSPCIDAGWHDLPSLPEHDFEGDPRIQHCRVDMGADESPYFFDCNSNTVPDGCDIEQGTSGDCNNNNVPDECEPQEDCNENGHQDICDIAAGTSADCNGNSVPDECDLATGTSVDCNTNGVPDECDLSSGTSDDCNTNGIPDECDLASGVSRDCNGNAVPDACDLAAGTSPDCNENTVPDECDLAEGTSADENGNGVPDECDLAPDVLYVDDDAFYDPGPGSTYNSDPLEDGSLGHPFDAIQEAIDVATDGHRVILLDGTYTGTGNKQIDFLGKSITVRSRSGPELCVIDCEGDGRAFYFHNEETEASVLDGVTIVNGNSGAILCSGAGPTITNCIFRDNTSTTGGAMYVSGYPSPTIFRCVFIDNTAGTGSVYQGGGAIALESYSQARIRACEFRGNSSGYGGAICRHNGTLDLANCLFVGNSATSGGYGGAVYSSYGDASIVNCTFLNNSAPSSHGGGVWGGGSSQDHALLVNCIFWDNPGGNVATCTDSWCTIEVHYSCVSGGWSGGTGNISSAPQFVDAPYDLRLLPGSPGIDAGDNFAVPADVEMDLDSGSRFVDDPTRPDSGSGTAPIVDMGAYETADCNSNGLPDGTDLMGGTSPDCNRNYVPDECDIVSGYSRDIDGNDVPDECESDCNMNGVLDYLDILEGTSLDCNGGNVPDECELLDCPPDDPTCADCNTNGILDSCDLAEGTSFDCNVNQTPDECEPLATGPTVYVDADATGPETGTSWAEALTDLQTALCLARSRSPSITEIRVAGGTYTPDRGTGERLASFELVNGVALRGGYAGTGEPDPDTRDLSAHETVLSGDIGTPESAYDNSCHVVVTEHCDETAVLDGVTIADGRADVSWDSDSRGGGMYNDHSSPTLVYCTFRGNYARTKGGGMCNSGLISPSLSHCVFLGNAADYYGGGIYGSWGASTLTNCLLAGNSANHNGGAIFGGETVLVNCTLVANTADDEGGGITCNGATLTNCIVWGNTAASGAQIYGSAVVTYSCVQGGAAGTGNIDEDPLFVDADGPDDDPATWQDNDYRLAPGSPANDAGDNTAVPADGLDLDGDGDLTERVPIDLNSGTRFGNDYCVLNLGIPDPPDYVNIVDMGPFEVYTPTPPARVYVDQAATGGDDGTSWADAYVNLQQALIQVGCTEGTDVWVAAGTYTPAGPAGDRTSAFLLSSGLALYGGFAGGETSLEERDWEANLTILSGDLNGDDVGTDGIEENAFHVVVASGCDDASVLDGFMIAGGNANGPADQKLDVGGGLYNSNGDPRIRHCAFVGNWASGDGGAVHNEDYSDPLFDNCTFVDNTAGGSGGGVSSTTYCSPRFDGCTFSGNAAYHGGGYSSVGFYCYSCSPVFANCVFQNNTAAVYGGAILDESNSGDLTVHDSVFTGNWAGSRGGALDTDRNSDTCTLIRCAFVGNEAALGGALSLDFYNLDASLVNCSFAGNTATSKGGAIDLHTNRCVPGLVNCLFSGNSATLGGGAIWGSYGSFTATNCTLVANTAGDNGGGISSWSTYVGATLTNCILWNNRDAGGATERAQIDVESAEIRYSCVQGWSGHYAGEKNIDVSPLFVDLDGADDTPGTMDDDGRLHSGSPCVDAGDTLAIPDDTWDLDQDGFTAEPLSLDLAGAARIVDDPCFADAGVEHPDFAALGVVDIGAYERPDDSAEDPDGDGVSNCFDNCPAHANPDQADCDGDALGDVCALALGVSADCNSNGVPDECDIADGTSTDDDEGGVPDECQRVLFVDSAAPAGGNGLTWDTAFRDLQQALEVATAPDMVWVATGVYVPSALSEPSDPRSATFELVSGVGVYGGFAGGETTLAQRSPLTNATILGGDQNGDDVTDIVEALACFSGPDTPLTTGCEPYDLDTDGDVDAADLGMSENTYHVVTACGIDHAAVLDGFTISAGNADGIAEEHYDVGGGMYLDHAGALIGRCVFRGNTTGATGTGGALYAARSSPRLVRCRMQGNRASSGGGAHITDHSTPALVECAFDDNLAGRGGAVYNSWDSYPLLTHCIFLGNRATGYAGDGGAFCTSGCAALIANCAFRGNQATNEGGAVYCGASGADPDIVNCTITGNSADYGGGVAKSLYPQPTVVNSILCENAASAGTLEQEQITGGTVHYSCVQGWTGDLGGEGNIDENPLFVDPIGADGILGTLDDDNHLLPTSPCIDTGDPASAFGLEPEPDGGRINMGAYGNTPEAATQGWLCIEEYGLVNKIRVGRTTFDYEFNLTMSNRSTDGVTSISAELLDVPDNVEIIDHEVFVGDLLAGGEVTTTDTFTIRVERSAVIDPFWISWRVEYTRGGRSEESSFGTWLELEKPGSQDHDTETQQGLAPSAPLAPVPTVEGP